MNLKTKYNRLQRVYITPLSCWGNIEEIRFTGDIVYEVTYYVDYTQKVILVYEDELALHEDRPECPKVEGLQREDK